MSRFEIRLAGEGGQGLILAGQVLAQAAINDGQNVCMSQTYGATQRGGNSRSEVIISDEEIDHPRVLIADVLIALTKSAFQSFHRAVQKNGIIIVDSHLGTVTGGQIYPLPLSELSKQATGKDNRLNIVALGVIAELTGIVSRKAITSAVLARAPKGTEEVNLRALDAGFEAARKIKVIKVGSAQHGARAVP